MTFSGPVRGLILAVQFLTRIPTPQIADFEPRDLSRSAVYFPLVGLLIGAALVVAVMTGGWTRPAVGALAGLMVWVWITGGLHLDGLGDLADALGAAHGKPERFFEVLRDPHTGSFAVIVIALQLIAKFVLLAELAGEDVPWGLLLVPAWARWGTLVWSLSVPPLQPGMAERFSWEIGWATVGLWAMVLAGLSWWLTPMLLVAPVLVGLGTLYWRLKLGGVSGDGLGAGTEVVESLLLVGMVAG